MNKVDCAIIAAAGLGSRLNQNKPKALINITDNKKIIDFQMEMLENINDIRIVVGYKSEELSSYIKKNYDDVEIIKNYEYKHNSICYSISMASKDLDVPYIAMCSDLIINKNEFDMFINSFNGEPLLAITPVKTEDCIYSSVSDGKVVSFQKNFKTSYEWANMACISKPVEINKYGKTFYSQLNNYLPLKYFLFDKCFEIDTPNDLAFVLNNVSAIL